MTVLHFLESLTPLAHKKGWLCWEKGLPRQLRCPACHIHSTMQTVRSIASPYSRIRRYRLYDCPACQTAHCPDVSAPIYENQSHGGQVDGYDAPKKFYVEQGAGLETMIAPFFWAQKDNTSSLLEVGCGYGFSLDFASSALGWTVQGIDPSHIARTGSSELGIPIMDGYLDADTKLDNGPFDLIFSSEVIEHIADPDPFVGVLAHAAGAHGTVLLTTPDIGGLRQERPIEEVIPLLSPGSHLVLFSEGGLKACLQRAGFSHTEVKSTGDTLYAFASSEPLNVDFDRPIDRPVLLRYLQEGLRRQDLPHHLTSGYAGRLLRAQIDAGDYEPAQQTFAKLHTHWTKVYGLDLNDPKSIETDTQARPDFIAYADTRPFNLTSALYCGGIQALNHAQDHDQALAYFRACTRSYQIIEPALTMVNASDLDSRKLAQSAQLLIISLLIRSDLPQAISAFENLDDTIRLSLPEQFNKTHFEVFAAAANNGEYSAAATLRPNVISALQTTNCTSAFERAAAMGLAMMALNYDFDRASGVAWLQKALEHAPNDTQSNAMRDIWASHAAAHGVELLVQGGQSAFATKRDIISTALQSRALKPKDFAIAEALGLAYLADQPQKALGWLEKALALSDDDHRADTEARINAAKAHIFLNAVNVGDTKIAAQYLGTVKALASDNQDPGLQFALGLDALKRRSDLDDAAYYFGALCAQQTHTEMAIQGTFHLVLVQARQGQTVDAQHTKDGLYNRAHPQADLVNELIGNREAELDAAIVDAA